jgi:tRNA(fMet)-specific endonuclease VapC
MAAVVIDTDVLSFLFKQDTRGDLYRRHLDGKVGVLSFMTVAELDFWADSHDWGARRRTALARFIQPFTVIDSDRELCRKMGRDP